MKKSLLLLVAAIGLTTTAQAQVAVSADDMKKEAMLATAPVAPFSCEAPADMAQVNANGQKRSKATGVWYKRPAGTYLQTGSNYKQMVVPPFLPMTYTNMYEGAATVAWKYGADLQYEWDPARYVVDGNYVYSYPKNVGTGAWWGTYMCVEGVDTFSFLDTQLADANPIVVAPDSIQTFMHVPTIVNYSGFTTFSYGTNQPISASRDGATDTYLPRIFYEFYRAPAAPLYLEGITLYARLGDGKTEPVEAGSEGVTVYVIQANDDSYASLSHYTDTVAVIPINPTYADISEYQEGYLTTIKAFCMQEDDFGDMVRKPVVLEKSFLLAFEGFNNEGVDFIVNMSKLPEEELYGNGGPYATLYATYWTSDNTFRGNYFNYNYANASQYNMHVRLNGMFDVAHIIGDAVEYTAPAAGGNIEDVDGYKGLYFHSVMPYKTEGVRVPNYQIEGLPNWLSVADYDDSNYSADKQWYTILNFNAQALPAGVEGRQATMRIVSEMGAKSQEFTVTQGTVATGINDITDNTKETKTGMYNLNGQRVGSDYKGIVIENGKKVIRK